MARLTRQEELEETRRRLEREKQGLQKPKNPKSTVLTKNADSFADYKEDRQARQTARVGSPWKQDAPILYEDKKFNDRKKTRDGGRYKWQGTMLKELPNKRYGRSYADKFDKLADEAGIPKGQRGAFKDYLDAQERNVDPNAENKRLESINEKRVQQIQNRNELDKANTQKREERAVADQQEQQRKEQQAERGVFNRVMDTIASMTVFDDTGYQRSKAEDKTPQGGLERGLNRFANTANFRIPENLEKRVTGQTPEYATQRKMGEGGGTDIISDLLGYVAPGAGITGAIRGTKLGADVSKNALTRAGALTRAKEGATVGGIMGGAEVGGREALNPEDYNWKQNLAQLGIETAGGAVLDPLVGALGQGARNLANRTTQNALDTVGRQQVEGLETQLSELPYLSSAERRAVRESNRASADVTPESALDQVSATTTQRGEPEYEAITQRQDQNEPAMVRVGETPQQRELRQRVDSTIESDPVEMRSIISRSSLQDPQTAKRIIETATNNPVSKFVAKFRQNYISDKSNANFLERDLLDTQHTSLQQALKETNDPEFRKVIEADIQRNRELRKQAKDTGNLMMAFENEKASSVQAEQFLTKHFKDLENIEGVTMDEMINWQVANRWKWLRENNREVEFPPGAEKLFERVLASDNPAFRQSEQVFKSIQEEMLDVAEVSGRISPEQRALLMEEPYYISFARDKSYRNSGDQLGRQLDGARREQRNLRSGEFGGIQSFGDDLEIGTASEYLANPIETLTSRAFSDFRSALRNDTVRELARLADIDVDGQYVKRVSEAEVRKRGGDNKFHYMKGYENGEEFYVQVHPEVGKMIEANDIVEAPNLVQNITRTVSHLKTASYEYLLTGVPRDLTQGYLNSEIKNPVKYAREVWKSLTDQATKEVDRMGVGFRNAYNPQEAGNNFTQELQQQINARHVIDGSTSPEKALGALKKAWNVLTYVQRNVGQAFDDVPRRIEANVVRDRWSKNVIEPIAQKIEDAQARLQQATPGDFGDAPLIEQELANLQEQLNEARRGMQREMVHRGRDVMNYQRSGDGWVSKNARKYLNFANTTTQSKDKMARSFMRDPLGSVAKYTGYYTFLGGTTAMAYDMLSPEDQEKYDSIPEYMKEQRYIIPLGNDDYISLPKSQELAILTNFADAQFGISSYEMARKQAVKELTPYQIGNVAQAFAQEPDRMVEGPNGEMLATADERLAGATIPSNAFSPLLDAMLNRRTSFSNKPISYSRDGSANDWTLPIFQDALGGRDYADRAQYLTQQYGGDLGKYGTNIANMLYTMQANPENLSALNPLQDYIFTNNSDLFRDMMIKENK